MSLDSNQVQKPVRKLRKIIKKAGKEPSSQEVHDLRTNSRRLEASLAALSLHSKGNGRRLLKNLSRVRKRAGKVRDMDVLTGYAATLRDDSEEDCKVQLLEHLGAKRQKGARRLHSVIADNAGPLRRELRQVSKDFDRMLCQNGDDDCDPKAASSEAAAAALRLQSELAEPSRLGRQNLHPYRLKVKELRNVLRMAKDPADKDFIDTLGQVKDSIGEWHDWEELLGIAQKVLDHGTNCNLLRQIKQRAEENHQSGLSAAENMRKRYLGVTPGKRKTGLRPAKPVWTLTSSMAA